MHFPHHAVYHETEEKHSAAMNALVAALARRNVPVHEGPARTIHAHGFRAVKPLLEMLGSRNQQSRWDAAKELSLIHDPDTADALVALLTDHNPDVRWLASDGLIAMGRRALIPLLAGIEDNADSVWMRDAAHRILRVFVDEGLDNRLGRLLNSLESGAQLFEVPVVAHTILADLKREAVVEGK